MRDMPDFQADDLMGWIAAVGALRVMDEVTAGRVRLVWCPKGGGWRLAALGVEEPDELAGLVHAWVRDRAEAWAWGGFDDATMEPDAWTSGARAAQGLAAELWCAIGSDGCRHRKGKIEASRLEYARGAGSAALAREPAGRRPAPGRGGDRGRGRRPRALGSLAPPGPQAHLPLGLALRARARPHGRRPQQPGDADATGPCGDGPGRGRPRQSADGAGTGRPPGRAGGHRRYKTVRWPVWTVPMGIAEVEALAVSAALLGPQDHRSLLELGARGVGAVMTARRWNAGKFLAFSRGQEVVRTASAQAKAGRFAQISSG